VIAPARRAALNVLSAVDAGQADLPAALARERTSLRDERDRSLAAELSIGTFRWLGQLDHVVASASNRPLKQLDREVLNILRLAVYQLLHLDRVPAAAVVDDAVSQARAAGKSSAAGFVNAVLRSIARRRHQLPLPPRPLTPPTEKAADSAALDYLSVTLSHPRWLVERWLRRASFADVEKWLRFNNAAAPLTLRVNTLTTTREAVTALLASKGISVTPAEWAPEGLIVIHGNPLTADLPPGLFVVQDETSQLVPLLVDARPGTRILDACAAPGGKTVALAGAARGDVSIVASDLRPGRVSLLRATLAHARVTNAAVVRTDVERPLPFAQAFQTVLLDAPCSGLGTVRRDPEIRWRRRPDDLPRLAAAQRQMLRHVAAVVRPGGEIVYSTCSSEPEENDEVVEAFVAEHGDFTIATSATVRQRLPARAQTLVDESGYFRTSPARDGLEAFFGAVLIRRG
jgi:16S rRNA (cytosine967-C5)-methyltransferase